jgi:hypothetical protein
MGGAILGPRAAIDLVTPTGVDGGAVLAFQLRSGKSAQEIVAKYAAMLGEANERLASRWNRFFYITELDHLYYSNGVAGSRKTPLAAEFTSADPVRGSTIGHMLVGTDFEDAVAWTKRYLRDAHEEQLDADLDVIVQSWENRMEYDLLNRAFSTTEILVGSAGYSVPWVKAASAGTVDYIPPSVGGNEFDNTHTHFLFQNTGAVAAATARTAVETMVAHLVHHGITGRMQLLVAAADRAYYAAMTGFVKMVPDSIQVVSGNSSAPIYVTSGELKGMPGELMGYYQSDVGPIVEVYWSFRIPTKYAFLTQSGGVNSPNNPLYVRVHPDIGFGMRVEAVPTRTLNPTLEHLSFNAFHGVNVGRNRLNGVAMMIDNASYTAPTIV